VGRFSSHKLVTLQLSAQETTLGFERFGEVLERNPPRVKLRIDRSQVARVLAEILAQTAIDDVIVEDPPLEQVIGEVFAQAETAAG
jgi:ABC-2 type transport system ATP-binding protein